MRQEKKREDKEVQQKKKEETEDDVKRRKKWGRGRGELIERGDPSQRILVATCNNIVPMTTPIMHNAQCTMHNNVENI